MTQTSMVLPQTCLTQTMSQTKSKDIYTALIIINISYTSYTHDPNVHTLSIRGRGYTDRPRPEVRFTVDAGCFGGGIGGFGRARYFAAGRLSMDVSTTKTNLEFIFKNMKIEVVYFF